MALSNAEKQAAWRARQAANKSRVSELEAEVEALKARVPAGGGLAKKLEPHLEALFDQGTRNMATMAPIVVMRHIVLLESILVEHGIVPETERARDPAKYAKKLQRQMEQSVNKAVQMAGERHKKALAARKSTGQ
jgi:hypothetical protein